MPGAQGQTPFIPRTGPAPAGPAKGRRVLGEGWPPAQPDKAAAGGQSSKPDRDTTGLEGNESGPVLSLDNHAALLMVLRGEGSWTLLRTRRTGRDLTDRAGAGLKDWQIGRAHV